MSEPSARLHGYLTSAGSRALVIRRDGDETSTFRWNLNDDSIAAGQRLAGRIYTRRSDLSPGGGYLLFFAVDLAGDRWTGISRAPYLNAQIFWPKKSPAYGGGMFCKKRRYWLNDGDGHEEAQGEIGDLEREFERPGDDYGSGCAGVYVLRLLRDGWELVEVRKNDDDVVTAHVFEKPLNDDWLLRKFAWTPPPWDDVTKETHELVERASGEAEARLDWEWAELDRNRDRLVWSVGARLFTSKLGPRGLVGERELVDLAEYRFRG